MIFGRDTQNIKTAGKGISESVCQVSAVVILVVVTFIVYLESLDNAFVAEDFDYLALARFGEPWAMLSFQFRPLIYLIFRTTYRLFANDPFPYHFLALLGHCLNVVLLFYLLRQLTTSTRTPIVAALLFALYPRNHEAVSWMSAGQYLYTTLFFLFSTPELKWLSNPTRHG